MSSSATVAGSRPAAAAAVVRGGQRGLVQLARSRVSGSSSSTTTADGTMYPGSRAAACSRDRRGQPAAGPLSLSPGPSAGTTYPVSRWSPGMSSRAITTARATPGQPASTASTSPGSIRNPRILT